MAGDPTESGCAPLAKLPDECMRRLVTDTRSYKFHVKGNTIYYQPRPAFTAGWGNQVSPRWQILGLAKLAGMNFQVVQQAEELVTKGTWIEMLPATVPADTCPDVEGLRKACSEDCQWTFPHQCIQTWPRFLPLFRREARAAIDMWVAKYNLTLPVFNATDVVIQDRCSLDTLLTHDGYGPLVFSFYNSIPANTTRIFFNDNHGKGLPACKAIHDALAAHLQKTVPTAEVVRASSAGSQQWCCQVAKWCCVHANATAEQKQQEKHIDFFRLVYAPTLYSAVSSFGLWAGLIGNNRVYCPQMPRPHGNLYLRPNLGPRWEWTNATVLLPSVATANNITLANVSHMVEWLASH